ncbi:helix-turn-helix transcriptional regulator [Flavobacterium chungbukense]|uniref:Helix-turn-helix transcriptional regulator n=1 Tax=Flavobacterium chungbukense TaxID=877464 RepID=A0ABP7Y3R6_9FLAO|nr:helix-turn-helix transcriptional regulator [Flavobacterium chungbukense]MCC4923671.1 helix-turn-helix domain-containing protein [Flavobacterium chungbukense]
MVNIEDFVKRLEIVMDYYSLSTSAFADKIGVQRSSMSHLLSGRNKPSLDFVMKILEVFPEIDLYWILLGTGNFPKDNEKLSGEIKKITSPISSQENFEEDLFAKIESEKEDVVKTKISSELENLNFSFANEEIEKIVIFYKNGRFKNYSP